MYLFIHIIQCAYSLSDPSSSRGSDVRMPIRLWLRYGDGVNVGTWCAKEMFKSKLY